MTSAIPMFYLGTAGKLVPMASPSMDIDRSDQFIGQIHTSLDGSTTVDARGYRREWVIEEAYLGQSDLAYLSLARTGELGPLRFLDPVSRNRFTKSTSLCSKSSEYAGGRYNWIASSGLVVPITGTGPTITYTAEDSRAVSYTQGKYLRWTPGTSGSLTGEVQLRGTTTKTTNSAPVLPNEELVMSIYVQRTSGAGTVSLSLLPVTAPDTFGTPVTSSTTTSGTWTQLTVSYTVPSSGVQAVALRLNSSATGTIELALPQLRSSTAPSGWTMGEGVGEVLITDLREVSPIHPWVTATITIRER